MSTDLVMPLREATQPSGMKMETVEGIYLLENRYTRTYLDSGDGTSVYTHVYIEGGGFTEQHWVISPVADNSFVIRNVGLGNALDFEADGEEGKHLECKSGGEEARQQWGFTLEEGSYFSIRNIQFSDKVLEAPLGGKALDDSVDVVSKKYIKGLRNQQWALERRSRTVSELKSLVEACPVLKEKEIAWPSTGVHGFMVIRDHVRDTLLRSSGLMREVSRPAVFDDKTFALKMKEIVQSWFAKVIKVDGYAVLFGMVGGLADGGSEAYNWYLMDDLSEIIFLDPLNGRELTAKTLQKKGFRAEWAIC